MNSIDNQSIKEIVDFINLTPFKTDMNLFVRLDSEEILNIYINCLVYLGAAKSYKDFELNEKEENLFAAVVGENISLKIIKVAALINHHFKNFGHLPNFSPVYLLCPTLSITQSTLMRLLDTYKKLEEYKNKYFSMKNDYEYTVKSHENMIGILKQVKEKNNFFIKTLEEGNKISNDMKNNIEKYSKEINELSPLIDKNKENIIKLKDLFNKKSIEAQKISKKVEDNNTSLNKLKERIVPDPESFNKIIEQNKIKLNDLGIVQNNLQKELDCLHKNNEICLKINEKLINLKTNVEEYYNINIKNKELYQLKEKMKNELNIMENKIIEYKDKYAKNSEILKNTELMLRNQQKEYNSIKSRLDSQLKENNQIKNDLKETLNHITNEILKYKSEIDKINYEKNDIENIRTEYANILEQKFADIIIKQNLYFQLFDKSMELYQNYNMIVDKNGKK
jgi:hypothetical protein